MGATPLLDTIRQPTDIRSLSTVEPAQLAQEMRTRVFDAISKNGGHLASNLGVVELTLSLHYCYDLVPYPAGPDRLLFDVGHQCYAHKLRSYLWVSASLRSIPLEEKQELRYRGKQCGSRS